MDLPPVIVLCNGASLPKSLKRKRNNGILPLAYQDNETTPANLNLTLPKLVREIGYLPPRVLDLLELAAYVFAADRLTSRGAADAVEYHSWARSFQFVMRVRDVAFWNLDPVKASLSKALEFVTGDHKYEFTFIEGHNTPPVDLFDNEEFRTEPEHPTRLILFSGGLDSLAGALESLETTNQRLCLITHKSQPSLVKTQRALVLALNKRHPMRVSHYMFGCTLKDERAVSETQRSRPFLYNAIAYALSCAYSQSSYFLYENGITAINFSRRQDLIGARASRTAHPQTVVLIQDFLSKLDQTVTIETPFIWKTKSDIVALIRNLGGSELVSSAISCSKTFKIDGPATHCGGCFQCIDRRLAMYASNMEQSDSFYAHDFVTHIEDKDLSTALISYIRQARDWSSWPLDRFCAEMLSELTSIERINKTPNEELVVCIHEVCNRHGKQVMDALRRIREQCDNVFELTPENSLLRMISDKEYLKEPIQRLISAIIAEMKSAIPIAYQRESSKPKGEHNFNDMVSAILNLREEQWRREFPAVSFGPAKVVPDHTAPAKDLLVESKYIRGATTPSVASGGIAEDIVKYPKSSQILFIVYDPERSVVYQDEFRRAFESDGRVTICIIN